MLTDHPPSSKGEVFRAKVEVKLRFSRVWVLTSEVLLRTPSIPVQVFPNRNVFR